ncbi:hypothetical protein BMF94_6287 [Rhodotorula taiwanensis]|uniref:FZ domain-containing protein n=1 Tax=Rhodotorula taiwanensis TaxID=741276 RepID=A0A2S5B1P0_9BASI|nr:hypothetical protein BMF94_6287 [Rhodotorula taiwanensis]
MQKPPVVAKTNERIAGPYLYRRRPPRSTRFPLTSNWSQLLPSRFLLLLGLVCGLVGLAQAQTSNLTSPSTTTVRLQSGESTLLNLAAPSTFPLYISLSLCSIPASLAGNDSFLLPADIAKPLYVSNSSSDPRPGPSSDPDSTGVPRGAKGDSSTLQFGYSNVTLLAAGEGNVTIQVYAPDVTNLLVGGDGRWSPSTVTASGPASESWVFELDISNGTQAAPYLAMSTISYRLEDTDASSVLLTATNQSEAYTPVISSATSLSYSLSRSRCYLRSMMAQNAATPANTQQSLTTRGYGPGQRTQMFVQGVRRNTTFTAWLVENVTMSDGSVQERMWDPVWFQTKSSSSCRLVYNMPACPSVAYAVPAPRSLGTDRLLSFFNDTISPYLANFTRTLTTFPCDRQPEGLFSVVSTCSDCADAYRDYVCAVTMPRCVDATSGTPLNTTVPQAVISGDVLASWTLPATYQTRLLRDEPFASRTPLFGPANLSNTFPFLFNASYPASEANLARETPFPYVEVPPCLDVCYLVQARCPFFLGFVCPKFDGSSPQGGTGAAAWGQTQDVSSTTRMANDVYGSALQKRAGDRWGTVYCNSLGSDLTMAVQFVDPFQQWPYEKPPPEVQPGPPLGRPPGSDQ